MKATTKTNTQLLKSFIFLHGDTLTSLSNVMGGAAWLLNAKIHNWPGIGFTVSEMDFIKSRYNMSGEEAAATFFSRQKS